MENASAPDGHDNSTGQGGRLTEGLPRQRDDPVRDAADSARGLLVAAAALGTDDPLRQRLRQEAISAALPYARRLARRYRNRGEPVDDLDQVAALGLVKAVQNFQPEREAGFLNYALPTILGELRRHFRDNGWRIRVPRRLQELRLRVKETSATVAQGLGRPPTSAELAAHLGTSEAEVLDALAASQSYQPTSLFLRRAGEGAELIDTLGGWDPYVEGTADRLVLRSLLAQLPEREQRIVALRFAANLSQRKIAERVGLSQMHVSRLLAAVIDHLRAGLADSATD
jgi:RNA polymerase sigma-B factor